MCIYIYYFTSFITGNSFRNLCSSRNSVEKNSSTKISARNSLGNHRWFLEIPTVGISLILLLHLSYAFSRTCKTIVYLIFLRTRVSMRSTLEGGKTSDRTPLVGIDKNYDMECYQSPGKHFHGGSSRMILPEKYQ